MNVSCNFAFNLFKDSPPHCALIRSFEFNAHTAKIKLLKITNTFVSTVARNSRNCNLISRVGCYDCMVTYNVHALIIYYQL